MLITLSMPNLFQTLQPNSDAPSLHAKCDKPSGLGFNFMNNQEKWSWVLGYEKEFEVSTNGNVRSYKGRGRCPNLQANYKPIKPCRDGRGYLNFTVRKDGKAKVLLIHIEMAKAFIPNPNCYKLVRHLNDIKSDNRIENLEWGTHSENMQDSISNGKHYHHTKDQRSKLSSTDVIYIINSKETNCELGRKFKVSESTISKIRLGRTHPNVTKIKYK